VQRRELTPGQRAIVAARAWRIEPKKDGRPKKGETLQSAVISLDALARQFHSSEHSILQARDLLAEAPDLAEQVADCTLSLAGAAAAPAGVRRRGRRRPGWRPSGRRGRGGVQ
jgi:hypothetical protein